MNNNTNTTGSIPTTTTGSIPTTTHHMMTDITQLLPNISSEMIVSLLNSGVDLMKLYSDKNYMTEKGMNFDSEMRSPSTNIYQKNFSGTSNVYSPYLYYNKNGNDNELPEEMNTMLGLTTTTTRPITTMGNTTTTRPITTMGNTTSTMGNTTTTRPITTTTTMGNTTTRPITTTTTTRPITTTTTSPITTTTMGNTTTTTTRPITTMGNTTTRPMTTTTTMGNTTTTMGNTTTTRPITTTTTMGNTTTTSPITTTTMGNTMGNTTTTQVPSITKSPTIILNPPEEKRSYTSYYNDEINKQSMLYRYPGVWTSMNTTDKQYMTINLDTIKTVVGSITQGRPYTQQWVTSYKVSVSTDNITYLYITTSGTTPDESSAQVFTGNIDADTAVENIFNVPIQAQYIRYHPVSWNRWITMRTGVIVSQ